MPREKSERQKTFPSRNFQALSRYSLLAYFLVLCQSGQNANAECIYDTGPSPVFRYSGGRMTTLTTELCYNECMKQGLTQEAQGSLFVGLMAGEYCFCGLEFDANEVILSTACNITCPGNPTEKCGGVDGSITLAEFSASPATSMSVTFLGNGNPITETSWISTNLELEMTTTIGVYVCSSTNVDCNDSGNIPPLEILVDYGDGSGTALWTQYQRRDVWSHVYTTAGNYTIFVMSTHQYDRSSMTFEMNIVVYETIDDAVDTVEIVCPDVIPPGEFFHCHMDVQYGSRLLATVTMVDDLDPTQIDTTGKIAVPETWSRVPSYPLPHKSFNESVLSTSPTQSYVLKSSYFESVANISQFEFVPFSTGPFEIDIVSPVCETGKSWCPITKGCQTTCVTDFATHNVFDANYECQSGPFCALEQTCQADLTCPDFTEVPTDPISYKVEETISLTANAVGQKVTSRLPKAVNLESDPDIPDAFIGLKSHKEIPWTGAHFLAIRCVSEPCITFPIIPTMDETKYDVAATLSGDSYIVNATSNLGGTVGLRVHLREDRILPLEKRFFCDRATEKTVHLQLEDRFGKQINTTTKKVSCQYPILTIEDLSENHTSNTQENGWAVTKPFPTQEEIDNLGMAKTYEASVWARQNEELTFHIRFGAGSHVKVDWKILYPISTTEQNECLTLAQSTPAFPDPADPNRPGTVVFETTGGVACTFPFRFRNVLYYGCTNVSLDGEVFNVCATEIDTDYNAVKLSWCNGACPTQLPRPTEVENTNVTQKVNNATQTEGGTTFSAQYILPTETELELKRIFTEPGVDYQVVMIASNMHNEDDMANMTWVVSCANPVVPDDWTVTHEPFIYVNDPFNFSLTIKPGVNLPTRPNFRIVQVTGQQRIDNELVVNNASEVEFFLHDPNQPDPNCLTGNNRCKKLITFPDMGVGENLVSGANGELNPALETKLTFRIPAFSAKGSHGFSIQFWNGISSIKFDPVTLEPATKNIQMLDPAPTGTGEWVTVTTPSWDYLWVETYQRMEGPITFDFMYTLPQEYGEERFSCDFVDLRWYLPAAGHPKFNVSLYAGSVRRIQYTFNNTVPGEYQPPPCKVDWPAKTFEGQVEWEIGHCGNLSEGIYDVVVSTWNPLDGWMSSKPTKMEVLEQIGPITIDDFLIVTDHNETKQFTFTLERAGSKTCFVVEWGDGSPNSYWGSLSSCRIRFSTVQPAQILPFTRVINFSHKYEKRGQYEVHAYGFDHRNFAESYLDITVFRMYCSMPLVWIPDNHTSFERPETIPKIWRSKGFLKQAFSSIKCNKTTPTRMAWEAYEVTLLNDPNSQVGKREQLSWIPINETISSYKTGLLNIPPLTFDYGLHKLVFRLEVETYDPTVKMFKEAFTYFNVTKSDLQPILMQGSIAKVSRGWGQTLLLTPELLSIDPDYPDEKKFNYTWWCRSLVQDESGKYLEQFSPTDSQGYPVFLASEAKPIPPPSKPRIINIPSGCFGEGPRALKSRSGTLSLNTGSLTSPARIYEILLVLEKDTRRAKVKIELEMQSVPAPIVTIECASLCFPTFSGVYVNPTSRLALRGNCVEECVNNEETYLWTLAAKQNITDSYCLSSSSGTTPLPPSTTTTPTTTTTTTTQPAVVVELSTVTYTSDTTITVVSGDVGNGPPAFLVVMTQPLVNGARKKRSVQGSPSPGNIIRDIRKEDLKPNCFYTYADGLRDGRDSKQLSIQQKFFELQKAGFKEFELTLNVTNKVFNGRRWVSAYGTSTMKIIINSPPINGTCDITIRSLQPDGSTLWVPAETGKALVDEFKISCRKWVDPDGHTVNKYVFKIIEKKENGNETTLLYSGPTSEAIVVFPVGEFHLYAEIHEEAQAYALFDIDERLPIILPEQDEYEALNLDEAIKKFAGLGDQARVSQMLLADASIRETACWFNIQCLLKQQDLSIESTAKENMTESQLDQFNELMKLITNANTEAIRSARDNLQFTTTDQLAQGATTLSAITSNLAGSPELSKTLDMQGREAAVQMIEKMAQGFKKMEHTDPPKLETFLSGVTGSVMAIMESLNSILYANDPDEIPLTDFERAAEMPYDTNIPEENADIPDDPDDALRFNVMRLTRMQAVEQVKKMVSLVDDIAETAIANSVEGEELRTKTPMGVQMIMSKLSGQRTVGRDTNGDGIPDRKLRFEFDNSNSVVQFPLGFCPGSPNTGHIMMKGCNGRWGIVIKEWETITATYPISAKNLNPTTKQIDISVYNDKGGLVDISNMAVNIDIIIGRMKKKAPEAVTFGKRHQALVNVANRVKALTRRNKPQLIYHYLNITRPYSTLNIQVKVDNPETSRLIVLGRYQSLPTLTKCDFIKPLIDVTDEDEGFIDWFIPAESINNRTGKWFFGVASVADVKGNLTELFAKQTCDNLNIGKDWLQDDFNTTTYTLQTYTSGCYYFNKSIEVWESIGVTVYNASKLESGCGTNHLSSYGSGWFPEVNTIDFEFVFAHASFEDNLTIYMLLIITFVLYIIGMIFAIIQDMRDEKKLLVPVLADNYPEDNYLYEIEVETGPLASHGTTSNIYFLLDGDKDDTGARCFTDPNREIFKSGALDHFILATPQSLGELNYMRLWTDSTGLGDMGAWYLLSITITDIQNGNKYRFIADQWLAIDRGSYEDDITIHAIDADSEEDPYYLLKSVSAKSLADDHIWLSSFCRPIRSRFTRKQRVSVCMAMLYLTFLANAMWYDTQPGRVTDPYFDTWGRLSVDPIDVGIGFISNFIVFPPILLAIYLFKRSRPFKLRKNRIDLGVEKAKEEGKIVVPENAKKRERTSDEEKRDKSCPSMMLFLGWLVCFICILGGAFIVFSFGLSFGNDKAYQWMVSMISAFFFSVLLTQPLKIILITLIVSFLYKRSLFHDDHAECDEEPPTIYFDPENIPDSQRRGKPKGQKLRMESKFYEKLKEMKLQEMEMKIVIRDLIIYFFYVAIIFIISYGNRDPSAYLSKQSLEASIIFGGLNCDIFPTDDPRYKPCKSDEEQERKLNFNNIRDVNEWYFWLEHTLLPNVRVQPWYNGKPPYGLRGYLDDRVNRIIGYAIVRQVREELGTCSPSKVIRDTIEKCTGDGGLTTEDERDWCLGWVPSTSDNCTKSEEFEYTDSTELQSASHAAAIRTYGGGGYILRLTGFIEELNSKIETLKTENWVDNRTRALIVEFSVYNAQVNMFGIVTCIAEFVGGGISPDYRIDVIRLFTQTEGFGYVVQAAEILFVCSIFYYIINIITAIRKEGCSNFFNNAWNIADVVTVTLSLFALTLYVAKKVVVIQMTKEFGETRGNKYIRLTYASLLNQYYEYLVSMTVFTSTIKFSKLLSFQKAFMQIGATIKLCFQGLATFIVEFSIVFGAFCSFFYFVLKNNLENFRDFVRTVENTMAMSIGKFNFAALRAADEMAAWIFFVFSIVVNMILINMMMAIINLSFEEIKENESQYRNKFELIDYIKRTTREMIGVQVAKPIVPVYVDGSQDGNVDGDESDIERDATGRTSKEFSQKTDKLLDYIEKTYLNAHLDDESARLISKFKSKSDAEEKKVMDYGFDALFMNESKKKKDN